MPKVDATQELTDALERAGEEIRQNGQMTRETRKLLRQRFQTEPYSFVEVSEQPLRILDKVLSEELIDSHMAQTGREAIESILGAFKVAEQQREREAQRVSAGFGLFGTSVQHYEEQLRCCVAEEELLDHEIQVLEAEVERLEE